MIRWLPLVQFIYFLIIRESEGIPWNRASFLLRTAKIRAHRLLLQRERVNKINAMPRPMGCPCAFDSLNAFNAEFEETRNLIGPAILKLETLKQLRLITRLPVDTLVSNFVWLKAWTKVFRCRKIEQPRCNRYDRYRTFDGTCNNIRNPTLGTPFKPQERFLKPDYDDDIDLPRSRSKSGRRLPNVREISNVVFKPLRDICLDEEITLASISWGLLIIFDTFSTPTTSTDKNGPITCCDKPARPECFPILVPRNDPFFTKTKCLDFVRKSPILSDKCKPGRRQQINQLNSYFDASMIYGLSKQQSDNIRLFIGGLLKVSGQNIPAKQEDRTEEPITQVSFFRLHNIFATRLSRINPHWNEERLFQETRKIIGAVTQKITYEEYLPTILNLETRRRFCLTKYCKCYDANESPVPRTAFVVAAQRYGHSQITRSVDYISNVLRFTTEQTTPAVLTALLDETLNNSSARIDRKLENVVRNKLLMDRLGTSLDLASVNLQRGRDTGVPSYTQWREFCGLSKVYYFDVKPGGLVDHTKQNARLLQRVYEHPDDIDLYAGGLSETPLPGAKIGPTFSCILAEQYRAFKVADRFFWDRGTPFIGFTKRQIRSIRRNTFAKVICETFNIETLQQNVFLVRSTRNPLRPCKNLPGVDLELWRERY